MFLTKFKNYISENYFLIKFFSKKNLWEGIGIGIQDSHEGRISFNNYVSYFLEYFKHTKHI